MKELFDVSNTGMEDEIKKLKQEIESTRGFGGKRNIFKIEEGEDGNKVRILPPMKGMKTPWIHYKIHFNLMGSNGKQMAILCGMQEFDECPLCRESQLFREAGDNLKAWNAAPRDQYIYNIIDPDGNIALMTADKNLQAELVKLFEFAVSSDGAEAGHGSYPWDLEKGCQIKIVKTKGQKSGKQRFAPNKWAVHLLASKPLDEKYLEKADTDLQDLTKLYKSFSPNELQLILDGKLDPFAKKEEKEEPDVDPPSKTSKEKVSSKFKDIQDEIEGA